MSAEKFKILKHKTDHLLSEPGKRLNAKGKVIFPFASLPGMGIKNFTSLKGAYKKVKAKTSPYSKRERDVITLAMALCQQGETELINAATYYEVMKK